MRPIPLQTVEALRQQVAQAEQSLRPVWETFSSGSPLDRLLPDGGIRRGTLVEILGDSGNGATAVALIIAREACRAGGTLVVVDCRRRLYPPAVFSFGIDPSQVVFVHATGRKEYFWSLNQSLACKGVKALLCWPTKLDDRTFRALQLAAGANGALGLFIRPLAMRGRPTWSELQLLIETISQRMPTRRVRLQLARCRHGVAGISLELELDDERGTLQAARAVSLVPALGITANSDGAAGASTA